MEVVTRMAAGTRMRAEFGSREDELPGPFTRGVGVFAGERFGHVGLADAGDEVLRVFPAFGVVDGDGSLAEVDVFVPLRLPVLLILILMLLLLLLLLLLVLEPSYSLPTFTAPVPAAVWTSGWMGRRVLVGARRWSALLAPFPGASFFRRYPWVSVG
jgi:hypothetical protein